mmetsp:Transcript_25587/g.80093  ORF Transcript_25587/g.80093 Transcript_25587/m.80093 type:complete len:247 (+) Transcript_25587:480-1220(+)
MSCICSICCCCVTIGPAPAAFSGGSAHGLIICGARSSLPPLTPPGRGSAFAKGEFAMGLYTVGAPRSSAFWSAVEAPTSPSFCCNCRRLSVRRCSAFLNVAAVLLRSLRSACTTFWLCCAPCAFVALRRLRSSTKACAASIWLLRDEMSSFTEFTSWLICASGWLNMVVARTSPMSCAIFLLARPICPPMSAAAAWNSRRLCTACGGFGVGRASRFGTMVRLLQGGREWVQVRLSAALSGSAAGSG